MSEAQPILCPSCHQPNLARARFCQHCGKDVILNNEQDGSHDLLRYRITRVIKEGGQGAVYEGIDEAGKIYAIKEMLDRMSDPRERAEALARFNAEAELLQGLSHPRVPRVYSHFTDSGRHYLTMDFIRGEDLEEIADREGAITEARALEWADQICDVLAYLHSKGLIYRDMKPSNVMIEREGGGVKVVDFGIAKLFKPSERGTQIGTPGYAPPEQYQGLATPASDIYALGATLHHLLTGRDPTDHPPFSFPPARDVNPQISRRTSDALAQALKMRPEERFASVVEFRSMLRPLAGSSSPQQVRVAPAQPTAAAAQVQAPALPSAQPATPPKPQPAAKPAVTRQPTPVITIPTPQPPAPPAKTQPAQPPPAKPAAPQRRRGRLGRAIAGLFSGLLVLALMSAIAFGAFSAVFPAETRAIAPWSASLPWVGPADADPTPVPPASLTTRQFSDEVLATVPSGSDRNTIINALRESYAEAARAQLGDATIVNFSLVALESEYELVNEDNGLSTYRAQLGGFVSAP